MSGANEVDDAVGDETIEDTAAPKMNLDVKIDETSACERHIRVTIPREDIDRYFNNVLKELMPKAAVPGFRAGRAPRKLVESRFKKDVSDQVKGSLLLDSMTQISESHELSPISEPDFDPTAVEVPDDGPMTFEFNIEVRPQFDIPNWKGLKIDRPVREFTREDVDRQLQTILAKHGRLVPHDGAASSGDYVVTNLTFKNGDEVISSVKEEVIRLRPVLSFRDGKIEPFDKKLAGVKAGEERVLKARLADNAPNEALRGKDIDAVFGVLEVKKLELPQLSASLLDELGGFENEGDLRDAIQESLERRLKYEQAQQARKQILAALTVAANWSLPPELLKRQSRRELERSVLELRRSGFSDVEIQAHSNELRQNSQSATARLLKEHFILERIAEEEKVEDLPEDYDHEISLIAEQSGESARRVRAQLEKRDLMDSLRNQIVERKVIDLILEHAKFNDVPFQVDSSDAEAMDQSAGGGDEDEEEIPEAEYAPPEEKARQHGHE